MSRTCPPCPLIAHDSLSIFLPPGTTKYSRLILYFHCSWSQLFLQRSLVPFIGKWYLDTKIWELLVLIGMGVPLLLETLSRQKYKIHKMTHRHTNTDVTILGLCTCMSKHMSSYLLQVQSNTRVLSGFSLSMLVIYSPTARNLAFIILSMRLFANRTRLTSRPSTSGRPATASSMVGRDGLRATLKEQD